MISEKLFVNKSGFEVLMLKANQMVQMQTAPKGAVVGSGVSGNVLVVVYNILDIELYVAIIHTRSICNEILVL